MYRLNTFARSVFVAGFALFMLVAGFAQQAQAQELKKRLAVLTFEDKTSQAYAYGFMGKDAGDAFSEMLTTALVKSGNYIVIERNELQQLLQEQGLGVSGIVTQESAAQMGKVLGAELVIIGAVSEFGNSKGTTGGSTRRIGVGIDNSKATVAVDVRIVDPSTSEIIAAENIRKSKSKKGLSVRVKDIKVGSRNEFDESIVGKAAREAVDGVVDLLVDNADKVRWQAKVVTMNGGQVFINAGSKNGVKKGMQFKVFRAGEALIDPDTGLNLGSVESTVGVIEVNDNELGEGKAARCTVIEGSGFERGDIVRVDG
ncbi:MAG: CsgG/HfaB family protein [Bacteroidota bacterium]